MKTPVESVLGRGVYGAAEALRLINFRRRFDPFSRSISRQTIARWLRGYDYSVKGVIHHSDPLWQPDYFNDDDTIELSFRVPIGSVACAVPKTGKCGPKDCDASPSNSSPSQAVRLGHFDAAAVAWFNHRATVCRRLFGVGGGIGTRRCHDESHQGLPREAAE
jgi:hypothetical protein